VPDPDHSFPCLSYLRDSLVHEHWTEKPFENALKKICVVLGGYQGGVGYYSYYVSLETNNALSSHHPVIPVGIWIITVSHTLDYEV